MLKHGLIPLLLGTAVGVFLTAGSVSNGYAHVDYAKEYKLRCIHCHVDNEYPGGSFFEPEDRYKWILLWTVAGVAGAIFIFGLVVKLTVWRRAKRSVPPDEYRPSPVRRFLTGILQFDLFRISRVRWLNYLFLSFSFILLLVAALGSYGLALGLDARTFTLPDPFGQVWDVAFDLFGLLILLGGMMGLLRRVPPFRNPYLSGTVTDLTGLGLILLLVLTGFLLEAFRIASFPERPEHFYSFVGASLALGLRKVSMPWTVYHFYLWNLHALIALAFIAYIPWSGFFHVLTCPVTQTTSRKREERKRLGGYGRGRPKKRER